MYYASRGAVVNCRTEPWRLHWVLRRSRLSRPGWGSGEQDDQFILLLRWNKKSTLHRLCSGEISFQPTAEEVRVFNSTGKYKVCEETVRWNPLLIHLTPQKYEFLKQIQLLPGKQQTDRRVWGRKRRGMHWDLWRSYASPGIAWNWWPEHLVSQKVPRVSILLPSYDTMPCAKQRAKGGEVL